MSNHKIKLLEFALMISMVNSSIAQSQLKVKSKPAIDFVTINNWPEESVIVSRDGKYLLNYKFNGQSQLSCTLTVQSTDKRWKKEFNDIDGRATILDDRLLFFKKRDSICLIPLGNEEIMIIPHVATHQQFQRNGRNWLAYTSNAGERVLVLRDLLTGQEQTLVDIDAFRFDENSKKLLYQSEKNVGGKPSYSLYCIDLENDHIQTVRENSDTRASGFLFNDAGTTLLFTTLEKKTLDSIYSLHWYGVGQGRSRTIWENRILPGNLKFDREGQQLVFFANDTAWYFQSDMDKMAPLVTNQTPGVDIDLIVNGNFNFSKDGKRVLFMLFKKELPSLLPGSLKLDVWSYRDKELQSVQLGIRNLPRQMFAATVNIGTNKAIRIAREGEFAREFWSADKYAIVEPEGYRSDEYYWQAHGPTLNLVSLERGSRQSLKIDCRYLNPIIELSPHEDYIIYYDPATDNYFSYDLAKGTTTNLTKNLGVSWRREPYYHFYNTANPFFGREPRPRGLAGWTDGDSVILVYDSYDIWKLDPAGRERPVNITHGYGRLHHIEFELDLSNNTGKLSGNSSWILRAFDQDTKFSGYFRTGAGKKGNPERLIMGPYSGLDIIKISNDSSWIIYLSNSFEDNSVYYTPDFKTFTPISVNQPQKEFNWYTTELVNWKLQNGENYQGILFKPEDFDPGKKYPILFHYYQDKSDGLYRYFKPEMAHATEINVPYFVSRGYLVFMPDIHYQIGHPGKSALRAIISAVDCLAKRPYIDTKRMGLAGHSWGGYETNYIVTHSHLFAAAVEGAGPSDFIADYNGLTGIDGIGFSKQPLYETGQARMGATLWQKPGLYIENSPIVKADQVTTPLLILHNKGDKAVAWSQGVEMFTALRRLGRRVWMLQYDGEGHELGDSRNVMDYTIRLTQFFDHYLKGSAAPKWMVFGIPASRKGIDDGLELDSSGREP